jgi:hypothetical protein
MATSENMVRDKLAPFEKMCVELGAKLVRSDIRFESKVVGFDAHAILELHGETAWGESCELGSAVIGFLNGAVACASYESSEVYGLGLLAGSRSDERYAPAVAAMHALRELFGLWDRSEALASEALEQSAIEAVSRKQSSDRALWLGDENARRSAACQNVKN